MTEDRATELSAEAGCTFTKVELGYRIERSPQNYGFISVESLGFVGESVFMSSYIPLEPDRDR